MFKWPKETNFNFFALNWLFCIFEISETKKIVFFHFSYKFKRINNFIIFRIVAFKKNLSWKSANVFLRKIFRIFNVCEGKMIKNMMTRYSGLGWYIFRPGFISRICHYTLNMQSHKKRHDKIASVANKLCANMPKNEFFSIEMFIAIALVQILIKAKWLRLFFALKLIFYLDTYNSL